MGSPRDQLALRAIVVGTRAAVRSHRAAGTDRMVRVSAQRGIQLLDELEARLGGELEPGFSQALADARRELTGLLHGAELTDEPSTKRVISRPD